MLDYFILKLRTFHHRRIQTPPWFHFHREIILDSLTIVLLAVRLPTNDLGFATRQCARFALTDKSYSLKGQHIKSES